MSASRSRHHEWRFQIVLVCVLHGGIVVAVQHYDTTKLTSYYTDVKTLNDVKGLKFEITHRAWTENTLFLRWSFQGEVKGLNNWRVEGMSEINFDERGLVCQHIDHWDAAGQFYEKLPLIGTIIRITRSRLQVS